MFKKKSQITIFIIIGLILIIIMVLFFNLYTNNQDLIDKKIPNEIKPIKIMLDECINDIFINSVFELGLRGGYYTLPFEIYVSKYSHSPFFYYNELNLTITKTKLKNNIEEYINDSLISCIINLEEQYNEYSFENNLKPIISINKNDVTLEFFDGLNIYNENFNYKLKIQPFLLNLKLNNILIIINEIIDKTIKKPKEINFSHILHLLNKYNLKIEINRYGNDTISYIIIDESIFYEDLPFMFIFGTKINKPNTPPTIITEKLTFKSNQNNTNYVEVFDEDYDNIEYYIDSFFFIDRTSGRIDFIPETKDIGIHYINITIFDGIHISSKIIEVEII
jgi:hypothetical protein